MHLVVGFRYPAPQKGSGSTIRDAEQHAGAWQLNKAWSSHVPPCLCRERRPEPDPPSSSGTRALEGWRDLAWSADVGEFRWTTSGYSISAVTRCSRRGHANARRHRRPRCAAARAEDSWSHLARLVAGRKRAATSGLSCWFCAWWFSADLGAAGLVASWELAAGIGPSSCVYHGLVSRGTGQPAAGSRRGG